MKLLRKEMEKMMKMKNILLILAALAAVLTLFSCQKDHSWSDDSDPKLSYNQILGSWQLSVWNGNDMTGSDTWCYLELKSDREIEKMVFRLYQNLSTAEPVDRTGIFELEYDEDLRCNLVSGRYDHEYGFWADDYIVRLLDKDTMEWRPLKSSSEDVSIYRRIDSIPE